MVKVVTLSAHGQLLQLVPRLGAAISRYAVKHNGVFHEFLRPATQEAIERGVIGEMSSFLMAPWAGRIQNGEFSYQGKLIRYPSRVPGFSHSMHGFTRDLPWSVIEQAEDKLVVSFSHQADNHWPFSFNLIQRYQLSKRGLQIEVEVENTGEDVMPFSMGHHPFFPIDQQTKLYANVQQAWFSDDELMPTYLANHPMVEKLANGFFVSESAWDTIFTGWDREATIEWTNRQLRYQVSAPMDFFVLYNPEGKSWFCAEPFGNITDSFNLREKFAREDIGGLDITPGNKEHCFFVLNPSFF